MLFRMLRPAITSTVANAAFTAALIITASVVPSSRGADDSTQVAAQPDDATRDAAARDDSPPQTGEELGVLLHESRAYPGYNLITPSDNSTYLFDNDGRVVHSWPSEIDTGNAYLLDNGHLFRSALADMREAFSRHPAVSGRFQEFNWDGNLVWDFEYHSDKRLPHHDAIKLPNGNALLICWERIDADEAIARGRRPETVEGSHLQPDCLVEIRPTGQTTGEVVWQWRSWDHLIQDYDRTRPNYGKVADHPERIDVNYTRGDSPNPDWMHVNAVAYNPELDQIALSSPSFSETWIIDHGTTTEEARGHTGGRWGQGGDLLYRWGNPRAYRSGSKIDQRLFFQHNIHWIAKGLPGEGHLLVFNNGPGREPEEHSSVDEFEPPIDNAGNYVRREHAAFGPDMPLWSYTAPNKADFYSWFISGAQRLPSGNTLINSGAVGIVFEVTPAKEIVWKFANPFPADLPPQVRARNPLFRALRYGINHPAFTGRTLTPGKTLVEIQQERQHAENAQQ